MRKAEATLEIEHEGRSFRGRGVSTDTVEAAIKAMLFAVNRIVLTESGRHTAPEASPIGDA